MSFQELVTYFPPSLYFHPLESSTQVPFSLDTPKYFTIPVASATPSFFNPASLFRYVFTSPVFVTNACSTIIPGILFSFAAI